MSLKKKRSRTGPAPREGGRTDLGRPVEFLQLLWAVDHALQSASKRMQLSLGVTGPQRLVLRIVGGRPGISPGGLAAVLHVDPSTLTGILRRLIAQGRLRSIPDPADRRRVILTLSEKGRRFDRTAPGTVEAGVRRTISSAPSGDIAAASRVLRRLAKNLEAPSR
ncbi:MAG: MarR family winged helix-turn-helix transcriptional regulator [Thermoanaerobaculia bacterium]